MDQRRQPARVDWDSLDQLLDDGLEATLERHFRELAVHQQEVPLAVDWQGYLRDERAGTFRAISLRRDEEVLGYSGFYVLKHRHYRHSLHALNDVIYVDQPLRNRGLGSLLVEESERLLRSLVPAGGFVRVIYHVKVSHPELGHLLSARGYDHVENGHWKLVRG